MAEHYLVLWASQNPQNAGPEMLEIVPEMLRKVGPDKWVMDQINGDTVGDTAFSTYDKAVKVATGHREKIGEKATDPEPLVFITKTVWP